MAKIYVDDMMKLRILRNAGLLNLFEKAAYIKNARTPNETMTKSALNTNCTGGADNSKTLDWEYKQSLKKAELNSSLTYEVLANENGRTLLIGTDDGSGGIVGVATFDLVGGSKPSAWLQYISNITISVKGDGEA